MFIRFVITRRDGGFPHRPGVFVPAYELFRGDAIAPADHDRLREVLAWFEENLPLPDRSRLDPGAIFWFKSGADALVRRVWDLVVLLKEYGHHVELIKTARPGRVCYEDRYQVGATPFRDGAS